MIGALTQSLGLETPAQWLVDTLVATTLLMALVIMLRRPAARFFGADIAYLLWLLPLGRLVMPPLTRTISVPIAPTPAEPASTVIAETGPALVHAPATGGSILDSVLASTDWLMLAFTIWGCGAALLLVLQLGAYLQNRRELLDDAVEIDRIDGIRVIEIAGISGPFAFGLLRRYIALPIGFERQYDPVERRLALAHELAHHRAGDLWTNFAGLLMLSLHWFNPIAWAAWRAFRFDQEAACDARVLKRCGRERRSAYARAIAKAATGQTLAFASPLNRKEKIVERLQMLTQTDKTRSRKWLGGAMISGGLVGALALTATVTYAVQLVPVEPVPPAPPSRIDQVPLPPSAVADAPEPPAPPAPPAAPDAPQPVIDATGHHVYTVKRNGQTIVLRNSEPLDAAAIDRQVAAAERSRIDADRALARADRQLAIADRAGARAEAMAERQLARVRFAADRPGTQVVRTDDGAELRIESHSCKGRPDSAAFMTQTETRRGKTTRSRLVTCGEIRPDREAIMAQVESGIAAGRRQIVLARRQLLADRSIPEPDRAEALADLDEAMADLEQQLEETRQELREELQDRWEDQDDS